MGGWLAGMWVGGWRDSISHQTDPLARPHPLSASPCSTPNPPSKHLQAEAALFEALAGLVERAEERVGEGHIAVPKPTLATHAAALEKVGHICRCGYAGTDWDCHAGADWDCHVHWFIHFPMLTNQSPIRPYPTTHRLSWHTTTQHKNAGGEALPRGPARPLGPDAARGAAQVLLCIYWYIYILACV